MNDCNKLEKIVKEMRILLLEGIFSAQSGHPGGSLSICDILTVLYFKEMNINPQYPKNEDRDRFVLSKGHAAPAYYAALALRGFFNISELKNLRHINSFLQGHPCMNKVPGVDMSTGSLGQGLSAANGMAMAAKYDNKKYRVYCICGDGEMQEGQIWEAAMTASHYRLDNLTLFVDCNGLQIDGLVEEVMNDNPMEDKLAAFGWKTIVIDGHNLTEIYEAIQKAKVCKQQPTAIICRTVKGKGVSFMENQVNWHGAAPSKAQYGIAIRELEV